MIKETFNVFDGMFSSYIYRNSNELNAIFLGKKRVLDIVSLKYVEAVRSPVTDTQKTRNFNGLQCVECSSLHW